jgi:hypothetical protein
MEVPMRGLVPLTLLAMLGLATASPAAEGDFLNSMNGSWSGKGTVTTRIGAKPVNVTCNLDFNSGASNLAMDGNCRGLLVVNRSISANITASGTRYSGTYTGPSGQPSSLSGSRRGNAINLAVRWAKVTNGDRSATMTIAKLSDNRLRLQTIDKDPKSGKSVVTSSIDLSR